MFVKKMAAAMLVLVLCLGGTGVSYAATHDTNPSVSDMFKKGNQKSKAPSQQGNKTNQLGNEKQNTPVVSGDQTNFFVILLKLVGALGIVILLIYFLYKMVSKKTKAFQDDGSIHNVGGVSVGSNRSVQLVKIGDEILVLGVGENVSLLKEIQNPALVESLTSDKSGPTPLSENVKKLVGWTKEKTGHSLPENSTSQPEHFKQLLGKALKESKDARTKAINVIKRKGDRHE